MICRIDPIESHKIDNAMAYNPIKHHRRSIRLKGYDYAQAGLYFITICTQNRVCLFGDVVNGEMMLNQYGQIAYNEWLKTPQIRNNVELGDFVIMPNHIHVIIRLLCRGELHSPLIQKPHSPDIHELHSPHIQKPHSPVIEELHGGGELHSPENSTPHSPPQSPSQTIGAIVRGYKSSVTKQFALLGFDGKLWQRNYYEHIIRDERSYLNISAYIINNSANWNCDSLK